MNKLGKFTWIGLATILSSILLFHLPAYAETLGSVTVEIKFYDGERAYSGLLSLKIFQDNNNNPYLEIKSISDNPVDISSLPINHDYKIEVYNNGILAGENFVNLQDNHQEIIVNVPPLGGLRVQAVYNDGQTPISNAQIEVKTKDAKTWASSSTDENGQTMRFYLNPTTTEDTYVVNVKIGSHLSYSYFPLTLNSGTKEAKIVTPWPYMVNNLLTVKILNSQNSPVTPSYGKFALRVVDNKDVTITELEVNNRGEAYLSNLKVGNYLLQAIKVRDNSIWGSNNVTIDGSQNNFIILNNQSTPEVKQSNPTSNTIPLWIKEDADKWSQNKITDFIFIGDIQYLLKYKLHQSPSTLVPKTIPSWFKNNSKWWASGMISDDDFISGIKFMIDNGIIS